MNNVLRLPPRHEPRTRTAWSELARLRAERARKAGLIVSLQREVAHLDLEIEAAEARERAGIGGPP